MVQLLCDRHYTKTMLYESRLHIAEYLNTLYIAFTLVLDEYLSMLARQ